MASLVPKRPIDYLIKTIQGQPKEVQEVLTSKLAQFSEFYNSKEGKETFISIINSSKFKLSEIFQPHIGLYDVESAYNYFINSIDTLLKVIKN
jgi:hypothetical protein